MKYKKLLEVCTPKQWTTLATKLFVPNGKYPVYGANGIIGYYNEYNHIDETVVIGCRGTCGVESIRIVPPYSYINGNAMCFDNLIEEIDIKFFYYFLKSLDYTKIITGVAQPQITAKSLSTINVPLLPLSIQKNMVKELDAIQTQISSNELLLQNYDDLIKSRFIELFGNLEENSKNWEIKSFSEFAVIDTNMTNDFDTYADYPHIGIDSIEKNTGVISGYRTIKEDNVISGKYLFTPKHIIYSKIRPNLNKVALPDFYGLCSADAYPILPKDNCNRIFLAVLMRSDFFLKHVLSLCGRANQPKVNKEQVQAFKSPLPPIELQNKFAEFIKLIDKSKFVYHSKNFLWLIFTLLSSTIAYSNVVSIFACPNTC